MKRRPMSTPEYGRVRTAADVGRLCRQERIRRGVTLWDLYETTGLSTRFLSEFERGKEHVSITRALRALETLGLDVIVVPRERAERVLHLMSDQAHRSDE